MPFRTGWRSQLHPLQLQQVGVGWLSWLAWGNALGPHGFYLAGPSPLPLQLGIGGDALPVGGEGPHHSAAAIGREGPQPASWGAAVGERLPQPWRGIGLTKPRPVNCHLSGEGFGVLRAL